LIESFFPGRDSIAVASHNTMNDGTNKFGGTKAVSGVQRRTWNKEEAAAKAREKDALADPDGQAAALAQKIREKPVERNPLSRDQSRDKAGNVDYMGQVGKVKMTTSKAAAKDRVGAFYCPLTGKTFSDNITYLDHINGKKYQKELGMNMRVERSTKDDVKQKLKALKRQRDEDAVAAEREFVGLDQRMAKQKDDHEAWKKQKRDYKEEKREREKARLEEEQKAGIDPMMAMMGLPMGFK